MAYSTNDIKHELACILFNIGSLHINLGAMDNRQTADGMKLSCSHFQCAAWAFQLLNDKYPQPRETDLCPDIIRFMAIVCLAQAQECILDKSIVDGRKPGIVAKVRFVTNNSYRFLIRHADRCLKSATEFYILFLFERIADFLLRRVCLSISST